MQAIQDIFRLWPTLVEMGKDIGSEPDTIRKWRKFGRIPPESWSAVIAAVLRKGESLTADDLMRLNTPRKPRGRPAHKASRRLARQAADRRRKAQATL